MSFEKTIELPDGCTLTSQSSRKKILFVAAIVIFIGLAFSWVFHVKPPFSSPDEGAHLSRADALRNGYVYLVSPNGKVFSGGEIDKSLNSARARYDNVISGKEKLTGDIKNDIRRQQWSGENIFYSMANTAFYFPAIYIPQAIGFTIGHGLELNVYDTYKLVSAISVLTIIAILMLAWKLYPIPVPALAVMILPMSIFQIFSPTIDGLTFALSVLMMSLFINILRDTTNQKQYLKIISLCVIIFILSSSRANLIPLTLFPLWLFFKTKNKAGLLGFVITLLLVMLWTYFSIKTVQDNGIHHPGIEQIDVLKHYVTHPFEVLTIIFNTVTDPQMLGFYASSFIGTLGWLNAPITDFAYWGFGISFAALILFNISFKQISPRRNESLILIFFVLSIVVLTFCALLVQWSTFPALKVDGVQGRYFTIPFIILGYAIMENRKLVRISYAALIILTFASVYSVHLALTTKFL